ncbi:MAG: hypothetical protein KKE11_01965, partial [Gammaproteobacteria bacterium]|nr:hypothetical protein [Gammaproteobacteria bacterium]
FALENGKKILGIFDKLGLEAGVQRDKPRGTTWYLSANFRIGAMPGKNSDLDGVARHMVDLVRRDVDLVSQSYVKTDRTLYGIIYDDLKGYSYLYEQDKDSTLPEENSNETGATDKEQDTTSPDDSSANEQNEQDDIKRNLESFPPEVLEAIDEILEMLENKSNQDNPNNFPTVENNYLANGKKDTETNTDYINNFLVPTSAENPKTYVRHSYRARVQNRKNEKEADKKINDENSATQDSSAPKEQSIKKPISTAQETTPYNPMADIVEEIESFKSSNNEKTTFIPPTYPQIEDLNGASNHTQSTSVTDNDASIGNTTRNEYIEIKYIHNENETSVVIPDLYSQNQTTSGNNNGVIFTPGTSAISGSSDSYPPTPNIIIPIPSTVKKLAKKIVSVMDGASKIIGSAAIDATKNTLTDGVLFTAEKGTDKAASYVGDYISDKACDKANEAIETISEIPQNIADTAGEIKDSFCDTAKTVSWAGKTAYKIAKPIVETAVRIGKPVVEYSSKAAWNVTKKIATTSGNFVTTKARDKANEAIETISEIPQNIVDGAGEIKDSFYNTAKTVGWAGKTTYKIAKPIVKTAVWIGKPIVKYSSKAAWNVTKKIATTSGNFIANKAYYKANEATDAIYEIPQNIADEAHEISDSFVGTANTIKNTANVAYKATKFGSKIAYSIGKPVAKYSSKAAWYITKKTASATGKFFANKAHDKANEAIDAIYEIPQNITDGTSEIKDSFYNTARTIKNTGKMAYKIAGATTLVGKTAIKYGYKAATWTSKKTINNLFTKDCCDNDPKENTFDKIDTKIHEAINTTAKNTLKLGIKTIGWTGKTVIKSSFWTIKKTGRFLINALEIMAPSSYDDNWDTLYPQNNIIPEKNLNNPDQEITLFNPMGEIVEHTTDHNQNPGPAEEFAKIEVPKAQISNLYNYIVKTIISDIKLT